MEAPTTLELGLDKAIEIIRSLLSEDEITYMFENWKNFLEVIDACRDGKKTLVGEISSHAINIAMKLTVAEFINDSAYTKSEVMEAFKVVVESAKCSFFQLQGRILCND